MNHILMWLSISVISLIIWFNAHATSNEFLNTSISKFLFICFILIPLTLIHWLLGIFMLFAIFYMKNNDFEFKSISGFQNKIQKKRNFKKEKKEKNVENIESVNNDIIGKESEMQRAKQSKYIQVTRAHNKNY